MGRQKDPRMADAKYVAVMLANSAKYARYDALDAFMTERSNRIAKMIITAMEHFPEDDVHDWDSLNAVVTKDGSEFDYDEPPVSKSEKAECYCAVMSYADEMRQNGFVANAHLMTEDFWETSAMVPL